MSASDFNNENSSEIIKYFDRINDNLFNFNNLLIGAFFALTQIDRTIPLWTNIIPITNLFLLIFINFRMLHHSRKKYDEGRSATEFEKYIKWTNGFMYFSMLTTLAVTVWLFYYLIWF